MSDAGPVRKGPLAGLTIIEMDGIGPVPLAGLMLAEMGAAVVRVERLAGGATFLPMPPDIDLDRAGREALRIDLKSEGGRGLLMRLVGRADVLIEGFRPGVMERLGAGPHEALKRNPGLVYGRMTGFGQEGPLRDRAGHDMTYLALSGGLHTIGSRGHKPVPPLNLVADYGGGTMFLIAGVLAALVEKSRSGKGQVVDAAMVDGAAMLALPTHAMLAAGLWRDERGVNLLDSGCPFYDTYETSDGRHVAIACLEPQFFAEFARLLPLDEKFLPRQFDPKAWPEMRDVITARIGEKPRDEWAALFEATDACVAPVLSLREAPDHPHNRARATFLTSGRLTRPAPAPRFSRTPGEVATVRPEAALVEKLARFGIDADEVETLAALGVVGDDRP